MAIDRSVARTETGAVTWMRSTYTLFRGLTWSDFGLGAAAVAYNAFLAMVPLAGALVGVAALFGSDADAIARVEDVFEGIAPEPLIDFVVFLMVDADARLGGATGWWIAGSVIVAVYLGARALVALERGLSVVSGHDSRRSFIRVRLVGVSLVLLGGGALLTASVLLVLGNALFGMLAEVTGRPWIAGFASGLRFPVAVLAVFAFVYVLYTRGAPRGVPRPVLSASLGTLGVVVGSLGFSWFLSYAPTLGATFAALGAVAITLFWFYLNAWSLLVAAAVGYAMGEPEDGGEVGEHAGAEQPATGDEQQGDAS